MFAVICIPNFALQTVLRHEPELAARPVAVLDGNEKQAVIFQLTEAARRAGVIEGLTPTQALARCGEIVIKPRSLTQEAVAGEVLIQSAYNFSPRIEATADGVCTLDLQGLSFGPTPRPSEEGNEPLDAAPLLGVAGGGLKMSHWAKTIISSLQQVNLAAQVGIAATPNVAFYAARCAAPVLVVEDPEEFLAALPVEILEPTPEAYGILRRWGIRTVGAFVALGQSRVVERLGLDALSLFRRASTSETRPLKLVTPPETFSESMDFSVEIETLEPLLFVLNRFVGQLTVRLDLLGLVAAGLELKVKLASGKFYERIFQVPAPTSNAETLLRMLHTHLENVRTDAPIVSLQLTARPSQARSHQFGLFEARLRNPNQFHQTLARLSALCGGENVGTPVVEDSFRPDAFRMAAPRFESAAEAAVTNPPQQGLRLRRFRPPFHADVEMEDGRPVFIASLKLNGPVEKAAGPWRSSGHWWEHDKLWNRDAWDIQARGGALYRIYREPGGWFVEGVFD